MNRAPTSSLPTNPFATRFVRAGAIPYLATQDCSTRGAWRALASSGWRGQIVGPHGSGKSTLLNSLRRRAARRDIDWRQFTLTSDQTVPLQSLLQASRALPRQTLLVIDGFEQVPALWQWVVARCRRGGLLVTLHRRRSQRWLTLPLVASTATSIELAERIVTRLTPATSFASSCLHDCYNRHDGNIREILFDLYDQHAATTSFAG